MNRDRVPVRHSDALEAEVDGQRVLLSPKDYSYFGLVGTGAMVWDRLDGATPLTELVAGLAVEFSADPEDIRADVEDFVSALDAAGLLAED